MKLTVNEAKLTGVCAMNCVTIQQVLILKFTFGPEELPSLSPRNGPRLWFSVSCLLFYCRNDSEAQTKSKIKVGLLG